MTYSKIGCFLEKGSLRMLSDEIRRGFLEYFRARGHRIVPSSSLVPHNDPTLLLTTAGMVQFKPYFLGLETPPSPRLASCQKCFRTTDIDSVGDSKHLTFFEMLGNFSIGDYFKQEAISWAWEYVTRELKLPEKRLWATVYRDDDEAYGYWRKIGLPEGKVVRLGEKDNFWGPAGDSGPCGPCSEVHFDFGESSGCGRPDCNPGCDCGRFVEIWNLVFTEYNQDRGGRRARLPRPNIDTGMGLERVVAVVGGHDTVYKTDLFVPLLNKVAGLAGRRYSEDGQFDRALRVVVEHGRGITFLIADGVLPSNEGRGYVLRRVLRRASLFGRKVGLTGPFLGDVADVVIDSMGHVYPELPANRKLIKEVILAEEERFNSTLESGLTLLEKLTSEALSSGKKSIAGVDVFRLYDTFGFPVELTQEVAREKGLALDLDGFEREMEKQRERARASRQVSSVECGILSQEPARLPVSDEPFVGYDCLTKKTEIVWLEVRGVTVSEAAEGSEVRAVLRETPFYAEMGGQVGDSGELVTPSGRMVVFNTVRDPRGYIVHHGRVVSGVVSRGEVEARVDTVRRLDTARNHTATHLLQAALRKVVGKHVSQKGSLVSPERLRFDFTQLSPLNREQLLSVQRQVNETIRQNLPVRPVVLSYSQAVAEGAIALFDEKYGETVRAVRIGEPPVSYELCGGTHVTATGGIGLFIITGESSVGAGVRRIEAVTGRGAELFLEEQLAVVDSLTRELKSPANELVSKVASLEEQLADERRRRQQLQRKLLAHQLPEVVSKLKVENGIPYLAWRADELESAEVLREFGDMIRARLLQDDRYRGGVVLLGSVIGDRPFFVVMVTSGLVARG
ncbi:MAG: alanine--tRNA ligase, partial [Dehalococcoidia bacterium]|nr:alanine--tRNA ligase [Dehalococcoidia bacterium]